jgi:hypothetical protein
MGYESRESRSVTGEVCVHKWAPDLPSSCGLPATVGVPVRIGRFGELEAERHGRRPRRLRHRAAEAGGTVGVKGLGGL